MAHFVHFVLGLTFSPWTLTVPLCVMVWTPVEGRPQVICSSQPVIAALGDDVILQCHVDPPFNVEELRVDWWRPDLPPDPGDPLGRYRYVHRYRDNQDVEDLKMSPYAGRTALVKDDLKHGNVSLKIKKAKFSDGGRYRCAVPQLGSASVIRLVVVDPKSVKTRTTETPQQPRSLKTADPKNQTDIKVQSSRSRMVLVLVFCVLLILVAGVSGGDPQVIGSLQPIIAAQGDEVILACHPEPDYNVEGLAVEWSSLTPQIGRAGSSTSTSDV